MAQVVGIVQIVDTGPDPLVLRHVQFRIDAAVEAGVHGALQALISVAYRERTPLPIQEIVHVKYPEIL